MFDPTNSRVTAESVRKMREDAEKRESEARERSEADRARSLGVAVAFERVREDLPDCHSTIAAYFADMRSAQTVAPENFVQLGASGHEVDAAGVAMLAGASLKLGEIVGFIAGAEKLVKSEAERKAKVAPRPE